MTAQLISALINSYSNGNTIFDSCEQRSENMLLFNWSGGDNLDEIGIFVTIKILDSGAVLASIGCYDLPNFSGNRQAGIVACNQLNNDELVTYCIDDEDDASAQLTILFNSYNIASYFSPEQVLIAATMMAYSVDDAYPILEDAM